MNIFNDIFSKIDELIISEEFSICGLDSLTIIFPTKRSIREFHEQFKKYFSKRYDFFSYPKCISIKNINGSLTKQERFSICWMLLSKYFPELSKSKLTGYVDDCFDFLDSYYYAGLEKKTLSNYSAIFKEAEFLTWLLDGYESLLRSIGKKDPIVENVEYLDKILSFHSTRKIFWVGFRNPFKIFRDLMDKYAWKSTLICNKPNNLQNIDLIEVATIYDESNIISVLCEKFLKLSKNVMIISNDKHIVKNISINLSGNGIFIDSSVNKNFWDTSVGGFLKSLLDFLCVLDVEGFLILLYSNCVEFSDISSISKFIKTKGLVRIQFSDLVKNSDFLDILSDSDIIKIKDIYKFFDMLNKSFSYSFWVDAFKILIDSIVNNTNELILADIFYYLAHCNNMIFGDLTFYEFKEICLKYLSYYDYEVFDQSYTEGIKSFGFLESRLLSSDITIIASCTDNNFPVKKRENFFISESFKKTLGIDFDADLINDFFDLVSNTKEKVFITKVYDNGFKPKFIHDIEKVSGKLNCNTELYKKYLDSERNLRTAYLTHQKAKKPMLPSPSPLKDIRPKRFSCTDIEYLVKNPYAIYVKYILKLKEINYLKDNINALKGNVIHKILENILKYKKNSYSTYPDFWFFSVAHITKWFTDIIKNREVQKYFPEIYGEVDFYDFSIFGRADRIDLLNDKSAVIVDYKTGTIPSKKNVIEFVKPQLLIESLILERGGFRGIKTTNINSIEFWKLGRACSIVKIDGAQYVAEAEKKLKELLDKYKENPYRAYIKKYQYMQDEAVYHLSRAIELI